VLADAISRYFPLLRLTSLNSPSAPAPAWYTSMASNSAKLPLWAKLIVLFPAFRLVVNWAY
jgi:hypothetical protein